MSGASSPQTGRMEDYEDLLERVNPKFFIRKVHSGLRDANAKHFEPALLSIGPYHHGKAPLQDMEKHKVHYLHLVMDRSFDENSTQFIESYRRWGEIKALDCYVDTFQMNGVDFEKCMIRDGFFMVGLFLIHGKIMPISEYNMLFDVKWMKPRLARDLLLFENQIPLFVLLILLKFAKRRVLQEDEFLLLALQYFEFNGRSIHELGGLELHILNHDNVPHLLGLVYHALVPEIYEHNRYNEWESFEFIRTAVALEEVGVKIHKADRNERFYKIHFHNGMLTVPRLVIDDNTESFFRNLVAYEQYSTDYSLHRVADYLRVMDCLINTPKDVQLLRHCGIIDNRIGDDAKVSTMFNHLCSGVYFDQSKFFYAELFDEVNKFCKNPCNMWLAKLNNDYFGSPWAWISFFAALALLVLTLLQTIFSGLAYYQPRS